MGKKVIFPLVDKDGMFLCMLQGETREEYQDTVAIKYVFRGKVDSCMVDKRNVYLVDTGKFLA